MASPALDGWFDCNHSWLYPHYSYDKGYIKHRRANKDSLWSGEYYYHSFHKISEWFVEQLLEDLSPSTHDIKYLVLNEIDPIPEDFKPRLKGEIGQRFEFAMHEGLLAKSLMNEIIAWQNKLSKYLKVREDQLMKQDEVMTENWQKALGHGSLGLVK